MEIAIDDNRIGEALKAALEGAEREIADSSQRGNHVSTRLRSLLDDTAFAATPQERRQIQFFLQNQHTIVPLLVAATKPLGLPKAIANVAKDGRAQSEWLQQVVAALPVFARGAVTAASERAAIDDFKNHLLEKFKGIGARELCLIQPILFVLYHILQDSVSINVELQVDETTGQVQAVSLGTCCGVPVRFPVAGNK